MGAFQSQETGDSTNSSKDSTFQSLSTTMCCAACLSPESNFKQTMDEVGTKHCKSDGQVASSKALHFCTDVGLSDPHEHKARQELTHKFQRVSYGTPTNSEAGVGRDAGIDMHLSGPDRRSSSTDRRSSSPSNRRHSGRRSPSPVPRHARQPRYTTLPLIM